MDVDDPLEITLGDAPTAMAAARKAPPTQAETRAEARAFAKLFGNPTTRDPDVTQPEGREASSGPSAPAGGSETGWGRYSLLEKLGAGGCSVVFVGLDETLDRKVAIKLLRAQEGQVDQGRLIREARALAKLNHPNIVEVFDVGVFDETEAGVTSLAPAPRGIYLVLELVDGASLDQWLRQDTRDWRTIVDKMVQAGRGLTAAHAAGVIHRDFKPGNVVIASDGRSRVLDFGLAAVAEMPEAVTPIDSQSDLPSAQGLTATGAVMGTPAYMPPEQHEGRNIDEASDQYAFCITLHLALWGVRPFTGGTALTLYENKVAGMPLRPRRPLAGVPLRIYDAIVRGTAVKPRDRWPSMDALLDELEAIRRPRRWPWVVGGTAVIGGVWLASAGAGAPGPCGADDNPMRTELAAVWGAEVRADAAAAYEASSLAGAASTWQRVQPRLDRYAAAWTSAYDAWCAAEDRDSLVGDERFACLRERLASFSGLTGRLLEPSAATIERAYDAVSRLPDAGGCEPTGGRRSREAQALMGQLAGLAAGQLVGSAPEGLRKLEALQPEIDALDDASVRARALLLRGGLEADAGQFDASAASLEAAFHDADTIGADVTAIKAATELIVLYSHPLGDPDKGLEWARHAEARAERAKNPGLEARWRRERAVVYIRLSRYAEARADLDAAATLVDDDDPMALLLMEVRGSVLSGEGRYDEALALSQRTVERTTELYGAEHVRTFGALHNLGRALLWVGDAEQSLSVFQRAEALGARMLPSHALSLAETRSALASVLVRLGRTAEAGPYYEQALAGLEGSDHAVERVRVLNGLGVVARHAGDLDRAAGYLQRVVDDAQGPDARVDLANAQANLGAVYAQRGELPRARASFEAGLATVKEALGEEHPLLAQFHSSLAMVHGMEKRFEDAHRHLGDAQRITAAAGDDARGRQIRVDLVEVLRLEGRDAEAEAELQALLAEGEREHDGALVSRVQELLAQAPEPGPATP
ncbi:MAG: tetratricopeptide repeat protein [Myxococcota bacterium]